jgi:hypothetical protein
MAPFNEKPAILPLKLQLPPRKRNAVILPPGIISRALPSPPQLLPFSPPFCLSPPPAALSVSTEEEELEWAFMDEYREFMNISSDRSSSGDDIIEDPEERDIDSLPELPYELRPGGYHNPGTRIQALIMLESGVPQH